MLKAKSIKIGSSPQIRQSIRRAKGHGPAVRRLKSSRKPGTAHSATINGRFGKRLAEMLDARQWGVYDLERESGIGKSTIYRILDGEASATVEVCGYLAGALGCTVSEMVEGID